jgi:hypothetical protein
VASFFAGYSGLLTGQWSNTVLRTASRSLRRSRLRPSGRISLVNPLVRFERAVMPIKMDCLERDTRLVDAGKPRYAI